eukprot:scaffold524_cov357-Pavlova_lutheri.AAC.1
MAPQLPQFQPPVRGGERGRPLVPLCFVIHFFYLPSQVRNTPPPPTLTNATGETTWTLQHVRSRLPRRPRLLQLKGEEREKKTPVQGVRSPSSTRPSSPRVRVLGHSTTDASLIRGRNNGVLSFLVNPSTGNGKKSSIVDLQAATTKLPNKNSSVNKHNASGMNGLECNKFKYIFNKSRRTEANITIHTSPKNSNASEMNHSR